MWCHTHIVQQIHLILLSQQNQSTLSPYRDQTTISRPNNLPGFEQCIFFTTLSNINVSKIFFYQSYFFIEIYLQTVQNARHIPNTHHKLSSSSSSQASYCLLNSFLLLRQLNFLLHLQICEPWVYKSDKLICTKCQVVMNQILMCDRMVSIIKCTQLTLSLPVSNICKRIVMQQNDNNLM